MGLIRSSSLGHPPLPITEEVFVRAALRYLVSGGIALHARHIVTTKTLENDITYLLDQEMGQLKKHTGSDIVAWVVRPLVLADPTNPSIQGKNPLIQGELDYRFYWWDYPSNKERHVAVEAKRLYGKGSSRADDYVDKGVLDFVTCKYSGGHRHAIMLGYVLIGPLQKAVTAVEKALAKRVGKISLVAPFQSDSSLCSHPHTHRSIHHQRTFNSDITLVHIFLDLT